MKVLVWVKVGVMFWVGVKVGVAQTTVMATELLVTGPPVAHWAMPLSLTTWQKSVGKLGL